MTPTSNGGARQGREARGHEELPFEITVEAVKQQMDRGEAVCLLDVREPFEHRIATIGGMLIPLNTLPQHLGDLDRNASIIVICHHGSRSAHATQFLRRNGFHHAQNMTGGIDAWSRIIDRNVPRY